MALQVWLPLINDVKNYGLLDVGDFSHSSLIENTNGKIGKCRSGWGIYHLEEDILQNSFSIATWIRSTGFGQYNDIIACKNADGIPHNLYVSIHNGSAIRFSMNSDAASGLLYNYEFETNVWYHIAVTFDGSVQKIYLNGLKVAEDINSNVYKENMLNLCIGCRSNNAAGTTRTGQNDNTSYNDFRIYDHCLSAKEVKELSKGLMAHYPLNDFLDDNIVYDASGYCNNGINIGAVVEADSPRYLSSLSFDGVGNYVRLPNTAWPIVFKSDFSVCFWGRVRDTTRSILFSNYQISGSGNFFCIEIYSNLAVRLWWTNSGTDGHLDKRTFGTVTLNEWSHLAVVFSNSIFYVYINGELGGSVTYTGTEQIPDTATEFRLGADGRTSGEKILNGNLSDVRVYATALSAEDIKELYQTSASVDQNGRLFSYELVEN